MRTFDQVTFSARREGSLTCRRQPAELPGAATAMKPRKGREDDASGKLTSDGSEHESDGNGTGVAGATVSLWYEFVDAVHALRRGTLGVQQPYSQRELTACVHAEPQRERQPGAYIPTDNESSVVVNVSWRRSAEAKN